MSQPASGTRAFGPYRLLDLLGEGGMGVVYLAEDRRLGRRVALKRIKATSVLDETNPADRDRFLSEVKAVCQLDHPSIVKIYEVGEVGGVPYFTMELVAGQGLDEVLESEEIPPVAAAQLCLALARALEHAHGKGIVHRDLKPSNVLVDDQYNPHLLDFGLAKRTHEETAGTKTGMVLGTPQYLAPEQVDSSLGPVGPATDVYGLGGILYHCLTGSPPHRGESDVQVLFGAVNEPVVPPRVVRPELPPRLDAICTRALEKKPSRRYASAAEMAFDLERFLLGWHVAAEDESRVIHWIADHKKRVAAVLAFLVALFASSSVLGVRARSGEAEFDERIAALRSELRQAVAFSDAATAYDRAVELEALGGREPEDRRLVEGAKVLWAERREELGRDLLERARTSRTDSPEAAIELARMAGRVWPLLSAEAEELAREIATPAPEDPGRVRHRGWLYAPEELPGFGIVLRDGRWLDRREVERTGELAVVGNEILPAQEARKLGYARYEGSWFEGGKLEAAGLVEFEGAWRPIDELEAEGLCYFEERGWVGREEAAKNGWLVDREGERLTPLEMQGRGFLPYGGAWHAWQDLFVRGIAGTEETDEEFPAAYRFRFAVHPIAGRIVEWTE